MRDYLELHGITDRSDVIEWIALLRAMEKAYMGFVRKKNERNAESGSSV